MYLFNLKRIRLNVFLEIYYQYHCRGRERISVTRVPQGCVLHTPLPTFEVTDTIGHTVC